MRSSPESDTGRVDRPMDLATLHLADVQFQKISQIVYRVSGIDLHEGKQELVKARLLKRLRALRMSSFDRYLEHIKHDETGREIASMVDVLTTNKTNFFREPEHLRFMREQIIPEMRSSRLTIWSAGCSSGEEPYSIAITLRESIPNIDDKEIRILATDISDRMLVRARTGLYDEDLIRQIDPVLRRRYFTCSGSRKPRQYELVPAVKSLTQFAKLNLMDQWPMTGPFDIIYCRNVMIYFDKPTQEMLVKRFWRLLSDGGYLLVGHSESLTFLAHDYRYIQPAVYQKAAPGTGRALPNRRRQAVATPSEKHAAEPS